MASFDEFEEIPEYFTCPLCFELPEAKIYQCLDGHWLCKKCFCEVKNCPECRLPFDKQHPIRNRDIEQVLSGLWTECPFKWSGCSEKILKSNLEKHRSECNFARFGELVNICKDMGYLNCEFKFNKENGKEAVQHLSSSHNFAKTNSNFKMELKSFKESAKGGSIGFTFWMPVVVELTEGFVVIMAVLKRKDASFTTWSIFLPGLKTEMAQGVSFQVEYSVHGDSLDLDIWKRKSLDVRRPLPRKINFNFNSVGFRPHCNEYGSLFINVKILNGITKGEVRIECPKRIILSLKASLTPEAPVRFDRFAGNSKTNMFYNGNFKRKCFQNRNNVLFEIQKIFLGFIPEGLELVDLQWIATEMIFMAAQYGSVEAVKYLLGWKVNFNICTAHNGSTPLHLTVFDINKEIGLEKAKLLVEFGGAYVDALDDKNNSALHFSAQYGNSEMVKYFIQKGLNVNGKDVLGQTPLFSAVLNVNEEEGFEIVRRLLEGGADPAIKDRNRRIAMDYAVIYRKPEIEKLLRSLQLQGMNDLSLCDEF